MLLKQVQILLWKTSVACCSKCSGCIFNVNNVILHYSLHIMHSLWNRVNSVLIYLAHLGFGFLNEVLILMEMVRNRSALWSCDTVRFRGSCLAHWLVISSCMAWREDLGCSGWMMRGICLLELKVDNSK